MKLILMTIVTAMLNTMVFGQGLSTTNSENTQTEKQDIKHPHSIGSSLWMLANISSDSANFYQLSYGYQLTEKDNIFLEAITWKYNEPLGTYGSSEELYPGKIKAYGVGLGYQRFHWKKLFTSVVVTPFLQQFYNENNQKVQKGFQLYTQLIAGYRLEFFKKRLYVEPAYALKYWPVNTNFPESFAQVERGNRNYKVEFSLNFGVRF